MIKRNDLRGSYDREADVLYLSKGAPVKGFTYCDDAGVLPRFSDEDQEHPCGATVLDYGERWENRIDDLARRVGVHLSMEPAFVARRIREIVDRRRAKS